jgi:hypothetical protein
MEKKQILTDEETNNLLQQIYQGEINEQKLPENLYAAIAEELKKFLYKGYGGSLKDFDKETEEYKLLDDLRKNIYKFSAAKIFQQIKKMSNKDLLSLPFDQFKEKAMKIFNMHNITWLQTESNTTEKQAINARQWLKIEKEKK